MTEYYRLRTDGFDGKVIELSIIDNKVLVIREYETDMVRTSRGFSGSGKQELIRELHFVADKQWHKES